MAITSAELGCAPKEGTRKQQLHYRYLWLLIVALYAVAIALCKHAHLTGVHQIASNWLATCMLFASIIYIRWRPLPKLIHVAQLGLAGILITNVLSVFVQAAGRSQYPLVDKYLAGIDASLNFRTSSVVQFVAEWPLLQNCLQLAYGTTTLLIIGAILVPPALGRPERAYKFILAVVIALFVTIALFYRWPAVGPWTVEGYLPSHNQAAVEGYLQQLRSTGRVAIDMDDAGIVSFPSFHVVLAVLAAFALGFIRRARWFLWALCILICISTITTGWHYGVDVIAGLLVAVVSLIVVRAFVPTWLGR